MTGALALFPRFILTAVRLVSVLFADAGTGGTAVDAAGAETEQERLERETVEIMDQLGNAILRLAYSYLHNMEDAEDILQETLIKFVTTKPVFENEKHRKAWLLTVAANLAKNRIEYNRVRSSEELNEEIAGAAPEEEEDDLSYVWEAVKKLPDNQREVIHLFYQEGYKTAEIANILGRKEATIRSDLKRARDKLKEILKRWENIGVTDHGNWANQEAMFVRQLRNMIIYAMAITKSARSRDESRGAHAKIMLDENGKRIEKDGELQFYPRNDEKFMFTSVVSFDAATEEPVVTYEEFEHSLIKARPRNYAVAKKE